MTVQVHYIVRPPQGGLSYEEWRDDAVCNGMDPALFELGDPDLISEADQQDQIAQGLRICSGCPVRAACLNSSNELDRYWTTRGGQPPEGLFPDSKMPRYRFDQKKHGFVPGQGPKRGPKKLCKRGHDNWKTRPNGKRRCLTCDKEREKGLYVNEG